MIPAGDVVANTDASSPERTTFPSASTVRKLSAVPTRVEAVLSCENARPESFAIPLFTSKRVDGSTVPTPTFPFSVIVISGVPVSSAPVKNFKSRPPSKIGARVFPGSGACRIVEILYVFTPVG